LYFLLAGGGTKPANPEGNEGRVGDPQFVLLPYGQNDVPLEHPVIVRIQVPEAELSGFGVPLPALPKGVTVEADLLIGQDGIARAVRVK
jgi:hypothetical protein